MPKVGWLIVLTGLFATLALSFAVPQFASANVGPPQYTGCRPDEPKCNPYSPPPTEYQAVGKDPDETKAQQEAEQDAATFCGPGACNIVYTLIYTCG